MLMDEKWFTYAALLGKVRGVTGTDASGSLSLIRLRNAVNQARCLGLG